MSDTGTELVGQVELFSFVGRLGCIKDEREFIFCVHDNGTLSALVRPLGQKRCDYDEVEKDEHGSEQHLHYGVLDGHAWKTEQDGDFKVRFIIGTCTWTLKVRHRLICTGQLSANGMAGTFRYATGQGDASKSENDQDTNEEEFPFELLPRSQSPSKGRQSLPLVPGYYRLRGPSHANWQAVTETGLEFTLHLDGTLTGEVDQYRGQYTEFDIEGTWTPDEIRFTAEHSCKPPFTFVGIPSPIGLRGFWRRCKGYRPHYLKKESAVLNLKLQRTIGCTWSKALYPYTPEEFRQSVRLMLLSSLRAQMDPAKIALPSDLWCHVFTFMKEDWFTQPKQAKGRS